MKYNQSMLVVSPKHSCIVKAYKHNRRRLRGYFGAPAPMENICLCFAIFTSKCLSFMRWWNYLVKCTKTALARSIFSSRYAPKCRLAADLRPNPLWELKSSPRPLNRGRRNKGKERKEKEREGGKREEERKEKKGKESCAPTEVKSRRLSLQVQFMNIIFSDQLTELILHTGQELCACVCVCVLTSVVQITTATHRDL